MNDFLLGAIVATACSTVAQLMLLAAVAVFFRYGSSAGSRTKDAVIAGQLATAPQSPAQALPVPALPSQLPPPLIAPAPSKSPPVAAPAAVATFSDTGPMSTFGGPTDTGMAPDEDLALYDASNAAKISAFLLSADAASQQAGVAITGLGRRLDPTKFYVAYRWDYTKTSKAFLRTVGVHLTNPKTGKTINCLPVDWGPNSRTGRVCDMSPGAAAALGLQTDDTVTITIPLPAISQPATQAATPTPVGVAGEPPWLTLARAEIGFHELPDNHGIQKYVTAAGFGADGEPWCAIFAGAMLRKAGVDITGCNAMAESFASAPSMTKIGEPRVGCIAVFWRGTKSSGTGHVGFYVSQADAGHINVLGGNESDQVMIEAIPIAGASMGLLGYYWPAATSEPKLS